ncbi:MAG: HAD-IIA family hydrolase [Actinomycetota bacterium]
MGSQLTGWALDLDGVIWRGTETVPGSPDAVARLRAAGVPIAFVTNSAQRTPAQVADKLASHGIPDAEAEVITAAVASTTMVEPGDRVLAIGSDGVFDALAERGCEVVHGGPADAVIMGITQRFDYDMMTRAMQAIAGGARFIATNTDSTFPTAEGLVPGNGALVASVATATGVTPEIAGKPHEPIAELVRERLGPTGLMVGDRADTDGLFAGVVGYDFALVLSGVTTEADLPTDPPAQHTAVDLATLVDQLLGH